MEGFPPDDLTLHKELLFSHTFKVMSEYTLPLPGKDLLIKVWAHMFYGISQKSTVNSHGYLSI